MIQITCERTDDPASFVINILHLGHGAIFFAEINEADYIRFHYDVRELFIGTNSGGIILPDYTQYTIFPHELEDFFYITQRNGEDKEVAVFAHSKTDIERFIHLVSKLISQEIYI